MIKVKLFGILKEKAGKNEVLIQANDGEEIIQALSRELRDSFSEEFFKKDGSVKDYYMLLLNREIAIDQKNLKKIKLKEGDSIEIFPLIVGG